MKQPSLPWYMLKTVRRDGYGSTSKFLPVAALRTPSPGPVNLSFAPAQEIGQNLFSVAVATECIAV